ncbi:MAG TPA: PIN domain-containing protein [Mycobacteriales bacterium]|nr:PIN domain-containing protein [Mycobacteriales bacterium]
MARARYLADTSVFGRLTKAPVAAAFAPLAAEGAVGVCAPVVFELGYATRNSADYDVLTDRLKSFPPIAVTEADHRRALDVQAALVARRRHRAISLVDALVAAAAEARDLSILHYDADFELIASVTGQSHQWIVTRGTAD